MAVGLLTKRIREFLMEKQGNREHIQKLQATNREIDEKINKLLDACNAELVKCPICEGDGYITSRDGYGGCTTDIRDCTHCGKTGYIIKEKVEPSLEDH